jgi:hypothetical protein
LEETTLELALADVKTIRTSFEVTPLYHGGDPDGEKLRVAVQQAKESLLENLNESTSLLPESMHQVFKHSALLLITPGVRRGFIDTLMKVDVLSEVARSQGSESPKRLLYRYDFTRQTDYFALSQMPGEQLYTLFLVDIIESASNSANYVTRLDFDRTVGEKFIALMYAITVAWRVFRTGEWPGENDVDRPLHEDGPTSGSGNPDPGGSGIPRVPITPTLVGAAANEIPHEELYDDAVQVAAPAPLLERIRI